MVLTPAPCCSTWRRDWSAESWTLGIDAAWLPTTYEDRRPRVHLDRGRGRDGLRVEHAGGGGRGDQAAAAVGVGRSSRSGIAFARHIGVVFTATDEPLIDPEGRLHSFYRVPDRWHVMGVMLSAAGSLEFRDALPRSQRSRPSSTGARLPGSDGVLFLHTCRERTPYPDPHARGAFVGLAARHGRPHLTRSVLEGVAFGLKDSLELMRTVGVTGFDEIRATGGGSKSVLWRQILADVLEMPVMTTTSSEGRPGGRDAGRDGRGVVRGRSGRLPNAGYVGQAGRTRTRRCLP